MEQRMENFEWLSKRQPTATPSRKVPDGPLCGNGDIGIAAASDTAQGIVDFYIGKNDIWNSYSYWDEAGMRGYGKLRFQAEGMKDAQYQSSQDLKSAKVTVSLTAPDTEWSVECEALRETNFIVHRITCGKGSVKLNLSLIHTRREEKVSFWTRTDQNVLAAHKEWQSPLAEWPMEVHSITKVWGQEAVPASDDSLEVCLEEGQNATVVTSVHTNQESEDCALNCRQDICGLEKSVSDGRTIAAVLEPYEKAHQDWWDQFWTKSRIDIPSEPLLVRYWYVSQYLMACCCEPGKYAPGIFGNWITTDEPAWGGDYHLNYNYQAPWWGLYSSNHIDLCEPYARPLMEYVGKAEKAAMEKLGCRGLYMLVGIGPKGLKTSAMIDKDGGDDVNYWGQKSNAAYAALNMAMQFYYTWDETYARETAYPFLYKTAQFWLDYLDWEDGRYVIHNDCIHENGALVIGLVDWADENEKDYSDDCNPILSLGLLRTLFRCLLDMGEIVGSSREDMERWKFTLEHLSEFPTMERNGETVFRYTESGRAWKDENSLGIQHIFPAGCIGLGSDKELLRIARNTFRQMDRWEDYNGFPTYFTAGVRLGVEPEEIFSHLKKQIEGHGFMNGFLFFGGGGIECCSAVPTILNEMMLQSHEGILRLFPVWDLNRDASFENLRAYGAFLVSAKLKNGRLTKLTVKSEKGKTCRISLPHQGSLSVTCGGNPVEVRQEKGIWTFSTEAGRVYEASMR